MVVKRQDSNYFCAYKGWYSHSFARDKAPRADPTYYPILLKDHLKVLPTWSVQRSPRAATQEVSSQIRVNKSTSPTPSLCSTGFLQHNVPWLINGQAPLKANKIGEGESSVFKAIILHFNEDFSHSLKKSFNIHTKLSLGKKEGDISSLIYLLLNI